MRRGDGEQRDRHSEERPAGHQAGGEEAPRPELFVLRTRRSSSLVRSTMAFTAPPQKMGSVVDSGRYAPTAKDSDDTPHSSMVTARKTPTSTNCQSRLKDEQALDQRGHQRALRRRELVVPIDGIDLPGGRIHRRLVEHVHGDADQRATPPPTPIMRPICWYSGVAPTR